MEPIWKEYLDFSRKELIGIMLLIVAIGVIIVITKLLPESAPEYTEKEFEEFVLELKKQQDSSVQEQFATQIEANDKTSSNAHAPPKLFKFDPNSLPEEGWVKLGISPRVAGTIRKYVSKGGSFKKPDDLVKIFGLTPEQKRRLIPYVQIAGPIRNIDTPKPAYENKSTVKVLRPVDINLADSSAFENLPGIGAKLASRIIRFREGLGGFYSIKQIQEVYGLQDSVFEQVEKFFVLKEVNLKKIDLNAAEDFELRQHPYLRSIAFALIRYRKQHGKFIKIEDVLAIESVTMEMFEKMKPYLEIR